MHIQQLLAVAGRDPDLSQLITYMLSLGTGSDALRMLTGWAQGPPPRYSTNATTSRGGLGVPTDTAFGQSWPDPVQTHGVRVEDAVMVGAEPITKDEV